MTTYNEWAGNPNEVDVLSYIDGLLRAANHAGLTVSTSHLSTIKQMIEKQYVSQQCMDSNKGVE